jgi:membrane dipeptidase
MTNEVERKLPVFDGHNDTLLDLYMPKHGKRRSFLNGSYEGHIDLPRAGKAGLVGGIFGLCVPPPPASEESDPMYGFAVTEDGYEMKMHSPLEYEYAREFTGRVLDMLDDMEQASNRLVKVVQSYEDLTGCMERGIFAVVLHFEGAEAIDRDLSNLSEYYRRGLRSLGPVWSRPNRFGCGVPFRFPHSPDTGPGLTDAGKDLVRECNSLGIMVDLAHMNEHGFRDVAKLTHAPLVVTHTNVFTLCRSTRNVTDYQISTVAESGGIIGISFVTENLNPDGTPDPHTPLSLIADHIDYVARKVGIDHVAFGSDFDGAEMPESLADVTFLPALVDTLRNRGYDSESLEKVAYRNWLRVLGETWKPL